MKYDVVFNDKNNLDDLFRKNKDNLRKVKLISFFGHINSGRNYLLQLFYFLLSKKKVAIKDDKENSTNGCIKYIKKENYVLYKGFPLDTHYESEEQLSRLQRLKDINQFFLNNSAFIFYISNDDKEKENEYFEKFLRYYGVDLSKVNIFILNNLITIPEGGQSYSCVKSYDSGSIQIEKVYFYYKYYKESSDYLLEAINHKKCKFTDIYDAYDKSKQSLFTTNTKHIIPKCEYKEMFNCEYDYNLYVDDETITFLVEVYDEEYNENDIEVYQAINSNNNNTYIMVVLKKKKYIYEIIFNNVICLDRRMSVKTENGILNITIIINEVNYFYNSKFFLI